MLRSRDLKSENIMVLTTEFNSPIAVKVADFGASQTNLLTKGMTTDVGTVAWMAPGTAA